MNKISFIFLIIILVVGGISIGNFMWANVNERRRELGILLMIGASKRSIYTMLLLKATVLGLFGGVLGYVIGTVSGMILGPQLAGIVVQPVPVLIIWSIFLSVIIAVAGSFIPAYMAAKLDPFTIMQEL
jgi:putative ABC transport system permease protein